MNTRNIVLFGAGALARIALNSAPPTERVLFIADNDARKHGTLFGNTPVMAPAAIKAATIDEIRITSGAVDAISRQLREMGVDPSKITKGPTRASPDASYLNSLRDKHRGRRAFIIGAGPSLRISDLDTLQESGEIAFAFNKIYLAFNQTQFRPSYYLIEDPLVAENCFTQINALSGFPRLIPLRLSPWFPRGPEQFHFNLEWDIRYPEAPAFSRDPKRIAWGSTVTYTALQWAVIMGCDPIYFIGMDFSFLEPKTRELEGKVMVSEGERNHFHPDYRPAGERWFAPNLEGQLLSFQTASAATREGPRIFNATRGGKLEVFPRVDFDALF